MRNYLQEFKTRFKEMARESPETMTGISVLLILTTVITLYGKTPTPQQVFQKDFFMVPADAYLALLSDLMPDIYCQKPQQR